LRLRGEVRKLVEVREEDANADAKSRVAARLFAVAAEVDKKTGAGGARLTERGRWSLGDFDGTVEQIFSGGEEFEM